MFVFGNPRYSRIDLRPNSEMYTIKLDDSPKAVPSKNAQASSN